MAPSPADSAPEAPLIVVADDDAITREYVAGLLRGHGFRVEMFENGSGAADRVARGKVSLALLDVLMPAVSGIEACRLIKSITVDDFVPVILLTGKTDADSRVEGLRIGADDYVCKPFDERELLARVQSMLRIKTMHDEVQQAKQRLEQLAVQDELTGLYNYRYLHTRLAEEFKRAQRYREPLACAMLDIDGLQRHNDTYGAEAGDQILTEVARRMRIAVREIDVMARYGGDEFLMVLPSTHFSGAVAVADRTWRAIIESPMRIGVDEIAVSASVGVALYPSRDVASKDELLKATDRALAQAKQDGKGGICVFQHQGYIYRPPT